MRGHRRAVVRVIASGAMLLGVAAASVLTLPWAAGQEDGGIGLVVTVRDSTASPRATQSSQPSASAKPTGSHTSSGSHAGAGTSTGAGGGDGGTSASRGSQASQAPSADTAGTRPGGATATSDAEALQGLMYVSGLTTSYAPDLNPLEGQVRVSLTVRNLSTVPVDGSALFWLTQPFGGTIGDPMTVPVRRLKAGETRTVSANLTHVGLWPLVRAHATFTPPALIGDTPLNAVSREVAVIVPTWSGGILLAGGAIATFVSRRRAMLRVGGASQPSGGRPS